MENKIIKLTQMLKPGVVYTSGYLKEKGYSPQLLKKYIDLNLVVSDSKGIYRLEGTKTGSYHAVYTIQSILMKNAHVASWSSLRLKGYSEQLYGNSPETIRLNTAEMFKIPLWLNRIERYNHFRIKIRQSNIFSESEDFIGYVDINGMQIKVSETERAVFELLDDITVHEDYEEAVSIFEYISGFRKDTVMKLLRMCSSIKVKRLFMFLSEKYSNMKWSEDNIKEFDLGSGVRTIVQDSPKNTFISKYKLLVPAEYVE